MRRMAPSKIQSSLLRMHAHLYGHFGLQLYDIDWRSLPSVLNVLLNAFFIMFVIVVVSLLDPFAMSPFIIKYSRFKPLFAHFATLGLKYVQPMTYFLSMSYYLVRGPRILHLLDSACFGQVFHSTTKSLKVLGIQIVLAQTPSLLHYLLHRSKDGGWAEFVSIAGIQLIHLYHYTTCNAIFYYQYATCKRLKQIERRLATRVVLLLEEDDALREIQSLATVNNQLNHLLSFPLLSYLFDLVYSFILFCCMVFLEGLDIVFFVHILGSVLYLFYLASLNNRLLHRLEWIFAHFKRQYAKPMQTSHNSLPVCITIRRSRQMAMALTRTESLHSRHLRLSELDHMYMAQFSIRTFQLLSLNLPFLFHSLLFVLNFVVLITQTN